MIRPKSVFGTSIKTKNMSQIYQQSKYKSQVNQSDPRYYKIKANFSNLDQYGLSVTQEIGRGAYGVVYKAISTFGEYIKKEYAVKVNFNTVSKEIIYSESAFLVLCKGQKNLPLLSNIFRCDHITYIVTEYFEYTPFIEMFNSFKLEQVKHYILQLLIGLKSLKDIGIYHRDIKPGNFLYNRQKKKGIIVDFGLAEVDPNFQIQLKKTRQSYKNSRIDTRSIQDRIAIYERLRQCLKLIGSHKIGTQSYMPIESILHHSHQTYESDIWPVGIILLQFVTRKYNIFNHVKCARKLGDVKNPFFVYYFLQLSILFGKQSVTQQAQKLGHHMQIPKDIQQINFKDIIALDGYDGILEDLLFKMLDLDVNKRIKVDDAINHGFFDSIRKQHLTCYRKK